MLNIFKKVAKVIDPIRSGEITISRYAYNKMTEYGLTDKDILDAWRYGKQEEGEKIVRTYSQYSVILIVRKDGDKNILTTCWKRKKV